MIQNLHSVTPSHLASRGGFPFPAASPAASRCSPSLATLSVCLGHCPTDSGGNAAPLTFLPYPSASTGPATPNRITPRHFSAFVPARKQPPPPSVGTGRCRGTPHFNKFLPISAAHPTIDVMQSSRARRVYSPLPLRLRLHNAGYYPTCQQVAAAHDKFTLRDRLCRLRSGASPADMARRVFKRSALFLATRRQTGPPPKCGGFGRRCGPHRSWPGAPKSGCW